MIVHIELANTADELKQRLQQMGWSVVEEHSQRWTASHDRVTTEAEARLQLQQLGLLTSRQVRIRFQKRRPKAAAVAG